MKPVTKQMFGRASPGGAREAAPEALPNGALILASDTVVEGFSLNLTELNQDPDQRPEEPKVVSDSAQEGKPRCINPIIFAHI